LSGAIDFTMCFLCLSPPFGAVKLLRFSSSVSCLIGNQVQHSEGQHLKFPIVLKNAGENKIKIKEKWEFLRKIGF